MRSSTHFFDIPDIAALHPVHDRNLWLGMVENQLIEGLGLLELTSLDQESFSNADDLRRRMMGALAEVEALKPI